VDEDLAFEVAEEEAAYFAELDAYDPEYYADPDELYEAARDREDD